jgi:hypothetical protein
MERNVEMGVQNELIRLYTYQRSINNKEVVSVFETASLLLVQADL